MHMQRRGWHMMFNGLARLATRAMERRAFDAGIELIRDVAYGPHPVAHRLDIYRPRFAPRPLPVLLYIHGGGFVVCSKETHRGIALLKAARPGYLVFNINYRLAPAYRFPAAIEDACAAYRWVVANAARYGGDPTRIVVAGESAGGNLSLGVAIAASYERPEPYARAVYKLGVVPAAVMPITPYLQASAPERHAGFGFWSSSVARDIAELYLGDDTAPSDANLMADPIRVLEECGPPQRRFPEVLSGVGTMDLCWADVRRLRIACRKLGITARVRCYRGEIHAFHVLRWRTAARRFWREMTEFLRRIAVPEPVPGAATLKAVLPPARSDLRPSTSRRGAAARSGGRAIPAARRTSRRRAAGW
jgi:acetyl esterase